MSQKYVFFFFQAEDGIRSGHVTGSSDVCSSDLVLIDTHGQVVTDYGTGALVELTRTDEILEVQLGGGAGYGDPRDRPVAEVEEDLRGGYVTLTGAERDYGCVVAPDGRIDLAATPALRAQPRPGCSQANSHLSPRVP